MMTVESNRTQELRRCGIALAFALAAAAPLGAQTLNVVMASRLSVLDPVLTTAHQTRNHAYMVYDTLVATDAENKIRPQMASWEVSPDGKSYTFTLRDGLKWHDGAPVKAEDCVASIKRWAQQDKMGRQLMPLVTSMDVLNDKSFRIVMSMPGDLLLSAIAKPSGLAVFMMPKRVADTPATKAITDYTGSGPFKFIASEFSPGVKVVYEKNKEYVPRQEPPSGMAGGKVANVDRVQWLSMADTMTAVNALLNNEIDYMETVPFDLMPVVQANDKVTLRAVDKMGNQPMYRFNQLHPPFNNKLIRQAAMYAIGQEDLLKAQVGNPEFYKTCAAVFGCGLPYASNAEADMIVPSNIAKAKELLKAANYDGAPVVILQATDIAMVNAIPVVMAQQLRQAGFKVTLQAMDFMTLVSRRANKEPTSNGGWSIFVTAWHMSEIADPLRNYGVSANGDKAWFGWATAPQVESLREEFLMAPTEEKRKAAAEQLQKTMLQEGVTVPLGQIITASAYRKVLTGVLDTPAPIFWNIKKTEK